MRVRLGGTVVSNDSAAIYRRWGYNDVCCPKDVRDAVENCPDGEELIFELNSGGGSVYQGFEMYSVIFAHKGQTTAEVLGIAGSAMSVVMAACDNVLMSPVANVMIHRASTGAWGNSRVMKETKQMLDTIDESILNAYTGKADGKSERDTFARMMRSETFLTAQQAIDCGLADGIMQSKGKTEGSAPELAVASATPWAGALELPPVEDLLRRERERETAAEAEAAEEAPAEPKGAADGKQDTQNQSMDHLSKGEEKQKRSEPSMEEIKTKEQLAEKFPVLTAQIAKEAADAAAKAERERIAGIEALAMPGFEDIIQKAKADPEQNAGTVAMAIVVAQKQAGSEAMEKIQRDAKASNVNEVPAASSEAGADGDGEETVEQAAKAAVEAWKKEGAVN